MSKHLEGEKYLLNLQNMKAQFRLNEEPGIRLELFFLLPTDHLSTLIKAIQGLPIAMRITFKASLLIAAYKAPDGLAAAHHPCLLCFGHPGLVFIP